MNAKRLFVNILTFARVPFILAWAVLAVVLSGATSGSPACRLTTAFVALVCAFVSGITDLFDGKLARKWGVVSTLGKMADPLMDKVFFIVSFPTLLWLAARTPLDGAETHALMMLVFTTLYMLRDTWVTFLRSVGSMFGADVAAMWLGKVRTALSFLAMGWIYMYVAFAPEMLALGWIDAALAKAWLLSCLVVEATLIVLTVWTLVTYTRAYAPYIKKALERK